MIGGRGRGGGWIMWYHGGRNVDHADEVNTTQA